MGGVGPVGGCFPRLQTVLQLSVDPLHHAVAQGVVGYGGDVFHA